MVLETLVTVNDKFYNEMFKKKSSFIIQFYGCDQIDTIIFNCYWKISNSDYEA